MNTLVWEERESWTWQFCGYPGPEVAGPQHHRFCLPERPVNEWNSHAGIQLLPDERESLDPGQGGASWFGSTYLSARAEAQHASPCNATALPILYGHEQGGRVWAVLFRGPSPRGGLNSRKRGAEVSWTARLLSPPCPASISPSTSSHLLRRFG